MPSGGTFGQVSDYVELAAHLAEVLLIVGLFIAWRQFRAEHERARREKAIEYILKWVEGLDRRATLARKLVEKMDFDTGLRVFNQEAFHLDEKFGPLLDGVFPELPPKNDGRYFLDPGASAELRWLIVSYLNNLEAVMIAWLHNVADRDIIASQFKFLVSPKSGQYILKNFREAAGGLETYPGIDAFVQHLTKSPDGKPPV